MQKRHKGHYDATRYGVQFEAIRFYRGLWILWAGPVEVAARPTKAGLVRVLESLTEADCRLLAVRGLEIQAQNRPCAAGIAGEPLPF